MTSSNDELLQCYNRGCGQKFLESENTDDACWHHPGEPFFHDAYKGWSCCNKKYTDFTEFLNLKGCTRARHSNVRPAEPAPRAPAPAAAEARPPARARRERPPLDAPLAALAPQVAAALRQAAPAGAGAARASGGGVALGTQCKHGGCTAAYEGPQSDETACVYHPGAPVFHEGLKFWSCCQRKTTDFNAFLGQVGCEQGKHIWVKEDEDNENVRCRWDFHQTGTHVVVAIYAKQYCVETSSIRLNPIRLSVKLVFPQQSSATFDLDVELQGIIDVEASQVTMYGTKVEINLKKAEPGHWPRLEVPKPKHTTPKVPLADIAALTPKIDAVDLDDL